MRSAHPAWVLIRRSGDFRQIAAMQLLIDLLSNNLSLVLLIKTNGDLVHRPWLLLSVVFLALSGCGSKGPRLYPVTGQVLVNGAPVQYVRVQFRHQDATATGNYRFPIGMTDATGTFQLSTIGDRDGAIPGDYVLTFEWLSGNELAAYDKFGAKFAKPETSDVKITIPAAATTLQPINLTIPEKEIVTKPSRPQ